MLTILGANSLVDIEHLPTIVNPNVDRYGGKSKTLFQLTGESSLDVAFSRQSRQLTEAGELCSRVRRPVLESDRAYSGISRAAPGPCGG